MGSYKNILMSLLFISSMSLGAQEAMKAYKLEEIQKHSTESSCWIIIDQAVYDVTSFLKEHPAPYKILVKYCGKESSQAFVTKDGMGEKHSKKAIKKLEKFKVGVLEKS